MSVYAYYRFIVFFTNIHNNFFKVKILLFFDDIKAFLKYRTNGQERRKREGEADFLPAFLSPSNCPTSVCLHIKFRTKVGITKSIENNEFFFRDYYVFGTKIEIMDSDKK